MLEPQIYDQPVWALLIFTDIIDSSKFSAVLPHQEYANRVLRFQRIFKSLGRKYFPEVEDTSTGFCSVDAEGDEGTIFCIEQKRMERVDLVLRGINFLYHLKGQLYFGLEEGNYAAPVPMGIGAGIHVGRVALISEKKDKSYKNTQIIGYSINKAKRVESASRYGKYSQIVLSKEATQLMEGASVVFSSISAHMKGIQDQAELYEVQAGLFQELNFNPEDGLDEQLINGISYYADHPWEITEPWLKSFIISALDVQIRESWVRDRKAEHRKKQRDFAWHSSTENDPLLLWIRAHEFKKEKKYTQQIRYLKQIIERHPDLVFIRKEIVNAIWEIIKTDEEREEIIFARDMAEEFLTKFSNILSEEEKIQYEKILSGLSNAKE